MTRDELTKPLLPGEIRTLDIHSGKIMVFAVGTGQTTVQLRRADGSTVLARTYDRETDALREFADSAVDLGVQVEESAPVVTITTSDTQTDVAVGGVTIARVDADDSPRSLAMAVDAVAIALGAQVQYAEPAKLDLAAEVRALCDLADRALNDENRDRQLVLENLICRLRAAVRAVGD